MVLNNDIIFEIIGNNKRFRSPYNEPQGYTIIDRIDRLNEEFEIELINLYYEKLRYAACHADKLIESAFDDKFYNFYGVDRTFVSSPAQMCSELYFDSFVMTSEDYIISSCLSNEKFMFGHFIEVSWNSNWKIRHVWIN